MAHIFGCVPFHSLLLLFYLTLVHSFVGSFARRSFGSYLTMSSFLSRRSFFEPSIIQESQDSLTFYNKLRECNDSYINRHIHKALDALYDTVRLYGPGHVFSSYNGGKDADVIMHLLRAVYAKFSEDTGKQHDVKLVFFVNDDEFDEVTTHILNAEKAYGLDITRYDNGIVQVSTQHSYSRYSSFMFFFVYSMSLLGLEATSTVHCSDKCSCLCLGYT
ncbi:hypothetical protein EON65_09440 [archaeon]|nr:MAG: hypothetical protein EON65_09440 [archaeon]